MIRIYSGILNVSSSSLILCKVIYLYWSCRSYSDTSNSSRDVESLNLTKIRFKARILKLEWIKDSPERRFNKFWNIIIQRMKCFIRLFDENISGVRKFLDSICPWSNADFYTLSIIIIIKKNIRPNWTCSGYFKT